MGNICCQGQQNSQKPPSVIRTKKAVQKRVLQQPPKDQVSQPSAGATLDDQKINQILQATVKVKKKIEFEDFQIDGRIGQGGFGVVYLVQLKENVLKGVVEKYAMKKVSKQILIRKRVSENAKLQKQILATLSSSNFIVQLVMAFQDPYYVYFVMQCATGGDTYSFIKKNSIKQNDYKALGENVVRFLAACVILGLQLLHKNGIMYRDLKPQNVLVFQNGYAKLTDFGLAKKSIEDELSKTISGTPFYYAPEMVLKLGYKKQVDLWTLGIYLFELSVLEPPFTTDQITRAKFKNVVLDAQNNRNWKTSNLSPELKDLINGLLKFDPKKRLGASGNWDVIKYHRFFDGFNWKDLEQQKMESPLKPLVAKYPMQIKAYKPTTNQMKPTDKINSAEGQNKIDGWTYLGKK